MLFEFFKISPQATEESNPDRIKLKSLDKFSLNLSPVSQPCYSYVFWLKGPISDRNSFTTLWHSFWIIFSRYRADDHKSLFPLGELDLIVWMSNGFIKIITRSEESKASVWTLNGGEDTENLRLKLGAEGEVVGLEESHFLSGLGNDLHPR